MRFLSLPLLLLGLSGGHGLNANDFPGWQGLRVVAAEGSARHMLPVRLGPGEGRALLLVNTRQSRLEFYHHIGRPAEPLERATFEDPNFLPMAEDFRRVLLPLSRLPLRATVHDFDGDGVDEILYIQGDPRRLILLRREGETWKPERSWDIAESDLTTPEPILVRPGRDHTRIFLSFKDGIQIVTLGAEAEEAVRWMQPREREVSRNRWWLVDLDEDGDLDLLEGTDSTTAPVRWYEAEGDRLRPAVNISEDINKTNIARLVRTPEGPRFVFLGANQNNTLSLYGLGEGEASPLGRRNLLPLVRTQPDRWASLVLDGAPAVVEGGHDKPVLHLHRKVDGFWTYAQTFPFLGEVEAIRAVRDPANRLLLRVKDEGRIYESHWEDGRFTFPRPHGGSLPEGADWKILAFQQTGPDTWWITRRGDDLVLSVLSPSESAPRETVFAGVTGDYERATWLGGDSLLLLRRFAKTASLCRRGEEAATLSPTRLGAGELDAIIARADALYLPKDGIVQILAPDLQVTDQIMLEGDARIRAFAPLGPGLAYALEDDGRHLHRLEADASGIYRTAWREPVPFALGVLEDPVLGLTLVGDNHLNQPSPGASRQLVQHARFDPNESSHRAREELQLSTLFVIDLDGDGYDEVAAPDYAARTVVVYRPSADGFEEVISWKVFDDDKYPYGRNPNRANNLNPYQMLAFDLDRDEVQDLILASHDRLLFYLARDPES
jgi:hypothetical protein